MSAETEAVALLRDQVSTPIRGTSFFMIGLMALAVAAVRRRSSGVRAIFWLGI